VASAHRFGFPVGILRPEATGRGDRWRRRAARRPRRRHVPV
jgi:hypothetical protein